MTVIGDLLLDNSDHAGSDILWDQSSKALEFADDVGATFGASDDLQIYHSSDHSYINNGTGNLNIRTVSGENSIISKPNGAVELYHDNVKQIQTTADGVGFVNNCTFSDDKKIQMGSDNDLVLSHSGSNALIKNTTGWLVTAADSMAWKNQAEDEWLISAANGGAVQLYYDNVSMFKTNAGGCDIMKAGAANFHIGSTDAGGAYFSLDGDSNGDAVGSDYCSLIHGTDGDLSLHANNPAGDSQFELYVGAADELSILAAAAGGVTLHHNGNARLASTNAGVTITGDLTVTGSSPGGITGAHQWRRTNGLSTNNGSNFITSDWEAVDSAGMGNLGTAMSESGGIFTFPTTGYWWVEFGGYCETAGDSTINSTQIFITDDNSSYTSRASALFSIESDPSGYAYAGGRSSVMVDVTNTSNVKVKFKVYSKGSVAWDTNTNENRLYATFIRMGDT